MNARDEEAGCSYVFDPDEWEASHGTSSELNEKELDDGCWHCPHPAAEGHEYCLFHSPPAETDASRVAAAFLEQIATVGNRPKQFIGAGFERLELEHAILESNDNYPIDLRHARIHGELDWRYAIVRQPLNFGGALFEGATRFDETTFAGDAFFSAAVFDTESKAYVLETVFEKAAIFYDVAFPGDTSFFSAQFAGRTDFIENRFESVNFREAEFDWRARFKEATFEHAEFHGSTFRDGADFRSAVLPESLGFRNASFDGPVRFREPETTAETCRVDLRRSHVTAGTLAQASDGSVVYDLQGATVGDVKPEDTERNDWFGYLHILNTTFDGFDFGMFRDQLVAANWRLHDRSGGDSGDDGDSPANGQLENTYLKAKNGANEIGDAQAAAEFFRKEMTFRRYQYVTQMREGESVHQRARAAWQWTANALLDITSGYGERPSRVIVFSAAVIVLFAALFAVAWPVGPYGGGIGYLLLSLESFITLVLGGGVAVNDPFVRLLAEVEGFVGAFLIALFVFTLTRSIHR